MGRALGGTGLSPAGENTKKVDKKRARMKRGASPAREEAEREDGVAQTPRDVLWQPRFPTNALPDYDLVGAPADSSDAGNKVRELLKGSSVAKRTRIAARTSAEDNDDDFIQFSVVVPPAAAASAPPPAQSHVNKERDAKQQQALATGKSWKRLVDLKCSARVKEASVYLHNELVTFRDFVGPSAEETAMRDWVADQVRNVAKELWVDSVTVVFGSASTGLSLPDSDVDICIFNAQGGRRAIHTLANTFKAKNMVDYMEVIDKAKVPIVKLRFKGCLFTADVCFDQETGPRTGQLIRSVLTSLPEARPLILVIKMFLAQRELNETYRGGVGSYLTFLTVISIVQRARRLRSDAAQNLGELLLAYFDFYGNVLNYNDVGISLLEGGSFFLKNDRQWFNHERPFLLSVENPELPDVDVGRNSWNIENIRRAFQHAHRALVDGLRSYRANDAKSILASILKLDVLADRQDAAAAVV